jgi:imidazolonepropionase-like amidohydrolase
MGEVLEIRGRVLVGPEAEIPRIWVVGGRVSLTRPPGGATGHLEGWVLPGLVDAHCHIGLDAQGAVLAPVARDQARTDRDSGVLLIRDAGSPAQTRWVDAEPDLPRLIRAGRHIARTKRYLPGIGLEVEPDGLAAAVAAQARAGDGWVKLVGDWIDRDLGDLAPCWPADALAGAVAAAHAEGARVTAHCFGADCLPDLLAAGIDCIEHATGLAGLALRDAAAAGVAVVPTLVNTANFPAFAAAGEAKYPRYAAQMRALHGRREAAVRAAQEAGLPIFAGTDAGGSLPHGLIAAEVAALASSGMPAVDAIDAACWRARSWLRRPGIAEGAPADVVVYDNDPRVDPGVLAHPRHVILRGARVGPPGR